MNERVFSKFIKDILYVVNQILTPHTSFLTFLLFPFSLTVICQTGILIWRPLQGDSQTVGTALLDAFPALLNAVFPTASSGLYCSFPSEIYRVTLTTNIRVERMDK